MRRSLAAAFVALAAAVATLPAAADASPGSEPTLAAERSANPLAATLSEAQRIVDPQIDARTAVESEHATVLMRRLFESLPELEDDARDLAELILARPSDGADDPRGYGYTTRSVKRCKTEVCLHWVRSTADAPPDDAWAKKSLAVLDQVYRFEVGRLGYRKPVGDGPHGGNPKFDVYLKDLGVGLYGFCVPEYYKPGSRKVASSYCVIDNDFAASQFDGAPLANLKVTLAHEFFHAVQYAYDIHEDPWIYESTAVWMEERFADSVNDNRQYLPIGQIRRPQVPLDTFAEPGVHYGNWVWWEYLSARFGNRIVRDVWSRLDANKGRPNMYSTQGLRAVLKSRGGFTKLFAAYAGANNVPAKSYAEGDKWPSAFISGGDVLSKSDRRAGFVASVDHMASRNYVVKPDPSLRGRWRLRITVHGPSRASTPAAYLIVRGKHGALERHAIQLTRKGVGTAFVGFSKKRTKSVIITVANTSTRFTCRSGTSYSCRGAAMDDQRRFIISAKVFQ